MGRRPKMDGRHYSYLQLSRIWVQKQSISHHGSLRMTTMICVAPHLHCSGSDLICMTDPRTLSRLRCIHVFPALKSARNLENCTHQVFSHLQMMKRQRQPWHLPNYPCLKLYGNGCKAEYTTSYSTRTKVGTWNLAALSGTKTKLN